MFHSTRWKAYLHKLQENQNGEMEEIDNILQAFHSQMWFTREKNNGYQKVAEEHLRRSDDLMEDCKRRVDALEKTLAKTPKPSEMMDWDSLTLEDLL